MCKTFPRLAARGLDPNATNSASCTLTRCVWHEQTWLLPMRSWASWLYHGVFPFLYCLWEGQWWYTWEHLLSLKTAYNLLNVQLILGLKNSSWMGTRNTLLRWPANGCDGPVSSSSEQRISMNILVAKAGRIHENWPVDNEAHNP